MPRFAIVLVGLSLAACKPAVPPPLDPDADAIARQFFEEVRTGADLETDPHLAHELKNPTTEAQIAAFRAEIPVEPPKSVVVQHSDVQVDSTGATTRITEIYQYADRTLTVRTALFKSPAGQQPVIVGFDITD